MCGGSGNRDDVSEGHENGEGFLERRDGQEEALRALRSYVAFQITLLRYIEDDPAFNISSW